MTKRLTLTLMLLFTFIILSACTPVKSVPVRTTEKVVEKLVPYRVEGASAVFLAHFECDSISRFPRMTVEEDSTEGRVNKEINYQEGTLKVQNFVPP